MNVTAIIPTLNERGYLSDCVASLREADEILIVDGGSSDGTLQEATAVGARVLEAPRGLAAQCRKGAAQAQGEVLLFIAADSRLDAGWKEAMESALSHPVVAGGGFRLTIDDGHPYFRLIEWGGNLRARLARIALPDQGLFVRNALYHQAGGMPESQIPFARLSFSLHPYGEFRLLHHAARTSSRKWRKHGIWKTSLKHLSIYRAFKQQELGETLGKR